jgi:hypothetical protein
LNCYSICESTTVIWFHDFPSKFWFTESIQCLQDIYKNLYVKTEFSFKTLDNNVIKKFISNKTYLKLRDWLKTCLSQFFFKVKTFCPFILDGSHSIFFSWWKHLNECESMYSVYWNEKSSNFSRFWKFSPQSLTKKNPVLIIGKWKNCNNPTTICDSCILHLFFNQLFHIIVQYKLILYWQPLKLV